MRRCTEALLMLNLLLTIAVTRTQSVRCKKTPPGITSPPSDPDGRFVIEVSGNPNTYVPGDKYTIFLRGVHSANAQTKFTNFLLVAEHKTPDGEFSDGRDSSVGYFQLYGDSLTVFNDYCPNSISETNSLQKTDIQVIWVAPPKGSGCVLIKATVVESSQKWYNEGGLLTKELCEEEKESDDVQPKLVEKCCACDEAKYEVAFEGLWSRNTHPKDFPDNKWLTRFSDIIGASHTIKYRFWDYGQMASEGLKELAEKGNTKALESELKAKSDQIRTIIKARGISHPNTTARTFAVFRVDNRHHLMSLVSMIQPSPDWIVGVSGLELCLENCLWIDSKIFNLYPWDAGTDDGVSYVSKDNPSFPRQPIRFLKNENNSESPFFDEHGSPLKPLARLILTRQRLYEKHCDAEEKSVEDEYCEVTEWGEWTCNAFCGTGMKLRQRAYKHKDPDYSRQQMVCKQKLTERASCHGKQPCRKDTENLSESGCELTEWGKWSSCSATCGNGTRTRSRRYKNRNAAKTCRVTSSNLPILEQNLDCEGSCENEAEIEENQQYCSDRQWSEWSPCSSSCGKGFKIRIKLRSPDAELNEDNEDVCSYLEEKVECFNDDMQTCEDPEEQNALACGLPKDVGLCRSNVDRWFFDNIHGKCELFSYSGCEGNMNNFRTLEQCERVCGDYKRDLIANRTAQKHQLGASVSGVLAYNMQLQNDAAPHENCGVASNLPSGNQVKEDPVDCVLSEWSKWSACNCNTGLKYKRRHVKQHPMNGGKPCKKILKRSKKCNTKRCHSSEFNPEENEEDVDCVLSEWSSWSPCSHSCGPQAVRQRTRTIIRGPRGNGQPCDTRFEERKCYLNACLDFSPYF